MLFVVLSVSSFALSVLPYTRNAHAYATTINTINFQARVQQPSGAVVSDGSYSIVFKLYSVSSGGTALWTETDTVSTVNGYMSVPLGAVTSFPASLQWDQQLYLGMTVGTDSEMTPRMQVSAVPFAQAANQLQVSSGTYSSTLNLSAPTGGTQVFKVQDQAAAGTFNLLPIGTPIPQVDSSNYTGIYVNKTGASGNLMALQQAGSTKFQVNSTGSITLGDIGGTGGILNNGKTTNTTLAMGDLATGAWGTTPYTAALTVDIYTSFTITPTASGRTYTIPTPTSPVNGQLIYVSNGATYGSSNSFTFANPALANAIINPGATATLIYSTTNGWQFAGADGAAIINQNSAAQSNSNFWINGSGTASSFLVSGAGGLDTNTFGGTLNIGTSKATTIQIGSSGTNAAINIYASLGLGLSAGNACGGYGCSVAINAGAGIYNGSINIGTTVSGAVNIGSGGQIDLNSATLIKPTTASTAALQVQNASSLSVLNTDTVNNRLSVDGSLGSMAVPSISGTGTATTGGTLAQNTTYYYVITAVDSMGNETTKSSEVSQLTGNTTATNTITLTWAPITGAAGYRIYRSTSTGAYTSVGYYSTLGTVSGANLTFTDTNGTKNNTSATPPTTNTAFVTVANANTNTPLQIAVGNNGTPVGQLYVSGIVPSGALGNISTTAITLPVPVEAALATATTGGNLPAATYYYVITAVDSAGRETTQSNQPTGIITTGATSTVTVTWAAEYSAASYRIYRSTTSGNYTGVNAGYYSTTGTVSGANLTFTDTYAAKTNSSATLPVSNTTSVNLPPSDIAIQGNYAYVTEFGSPNSRLEIFDISNPVNPVSISTLSINAYANNIIVSGRYAYIGTGMFGAGAAGTIQTINISNPSVPVSITSLSVGAFSIGATALGAFSHDMVLIGNILYVNLTSTGNGGYHQAYNAANPAGLNSLMGTALSSVNGGSTHALAANGRYLYSIGGSTSYLETVDTAVPTAMTLAGTLSGYGNATASATQGRYLYMTNGGSLYIFDTANPAAPLRVSLLATGFTGDNSISVAGRYVYVTNKGSGNVQIIDISNPQNPFSVGTFSTGTSPTGSAISGRYLFVVNSGSNTLQTFDLGGTYSQNIQSGNEQTSNLQVDNSAQINGSLTVVSGLNVSGTTNLQGSVDIGTSSSYTNRINLGNGGGATLTLKGGNTSYTLSGGVSAIQSTTNSSNAFMLTNASAQNEILLNTTSTNLNLIGNSDFEYNAGTGSWLAKNAATITNGNTYSYEGNYSEIITTNTTANAGMSLAYTLAPSTTYTLSVYARASSSVASDFIMGRQDVSGTDVSCAGQTLSTTTWTRYTCTFTTGATITSSNIYFQRAGLTNYSIYLDAVQLQTGSTATAWTPSTGSIQISAPITNGVMIQNTNNSPYEFQVMNAAGSQLFGVDSQNVSTTVNTTLTLNSNLNLPTPTAPTVTPTGASNSITYTYAIVAVASNGQLSLASPTGNTPLGNSSLVTASNTIAWSAVSGASYYRVYRTASGGTPSSTGLIGTTANTSFSDTGIAGDGSTYNSTANTGGLSVIDSVNTNYLSLGSTSTLGIGLGRSGSTITNYGAVLNATGANTYSSATTAIPSSYLTNASSLAISAPSAGITYTLPSLTSADTGRTVYVYNAGTNQFYLTIASSVSPYTTNLNFTTASTATLFWNGTAWTSAGLDAGATSLGAYDTATPSATYGATLQNNVLTFQSASASAPGMVSTGTQTFAGAKTFNGNVLLGSSSILDSAGTLNIGTSTATTIQIGSAATADTININAGKSSTGLVGKSISITAGSGSGVGLGFGGNISLLAGDGSGTQTGSLAGSIYIDAGISNGSAGNGKINIGNSGSTSGNAASILIGNTSSNIVMQSVNVNLSSAGVLQLAGAQTADITTAPVTTGSIAANAITIQPGSTSGAPAGAAVNIMGGGYNGAGFNAGGNVVLQGGPGWGGGSVKIYGGNGYNSTFGGSVNIGNNSSTNQTTFQNASNSVATLSLNYAPYSPTVDNFSNSTLWTSAATGWTTAATAATHTSGQTTPFSAISYNDISNQATVYVTQSGTTVTGTGTVFTAAMVGSQIIINGNTVERITARASNTSITVDTSNTFLCGIFGCPSFNVNPIGAPPTGYYNVQFTISGNTNGGGITVSLGNATSSVIYDQNGTESVVLANTSGTSPLTFTPTGAGTFNGTIAAVSVKSIANMTPVLSVLNSSGVSNIQVTASSDTSNLFIGYGSGQLNLSGGTGNISLGSNALSANLTGAGNSGVGYNALQNNTTGNYNSALGQSSLQYNTIGSNNTALGFGSLQNNGSGSSNTAEGYLSLQSNTTGNGNMANGFAALQRNTTGANNSALGTQSGYSNVTGSNNIFLGYNAGYQDSGASFATSSNLSNATAIGVYSQVQNSNTISLGSVDTATQVVVGSTIGYSNALFGVAPVAYSTGTAGTGSSSSTSVTGVGTSWSSVVAGDLMIWQDGQSAIIASVGSTTSITLSTAVTEANTQKYRIQSIGLQVSSAAGTQGYVGIGTASPSTTLDVENTNISTAVATFRNSNGSCTINPTTTSLSCSSDETLKKDITGYNTTTALNDILGLTAVSYHWNSEDSSLDPTHTGFIAQEVQKILPDLVATDSDTGKLSLSYAGLTPYIVAGMQAQQQQINQTKTDVTQLQTAANIINGGAVNGDLSITGSMNVAGNLNASGPVAISSTLSVTGDATFSGNLTVQNISVQNITINGHIITAGDTPTASVDTAAGTADPLNSIAAPTVTIDGNDTAGTITITTGANTSSGTLANITFNTPYGKAPRVILNADNSAMTNLKYFKASTSTAFTIQTVDSPTPNTTYQLDYFIAQ